MESLCISVNWTWYVDCKRIYSSTLDELLKSNNFSLKMHEKYPSIVFLVIKHWWKFVLLLKIVSLFIQQKLINDQLIKAYDRKCKFLLAFPYINMRFCKIIVVCLSATLTKRYFFLFFLIFVFPGLIFLAVGLSWRIAVLERECTVNCSNNCLV